MTVMTIKIPFRLPLTVSKVNNFIILFMEKFVVKT